MKKTIVCKWLSIVWIVCIGLTACNKSELEPGAATISIFNGIVGSQAMVVNFNSDQPLTYFTTAAKFNYAAFNSTYKFNSFSGQRRLSVYAYPDTAGTPLKDVSLDLPIGSIHSLFLTGTLSMPDTVFIQEHIPYYGTDSVAGIRFINLSPVDRPISVNLVGKSPGSEVNRLAYKGVSRFMPYLANTSVSDYTFEFRDAASGALIITYRASNVGQPGFDWLPNNWMFRNNTLALTGIPGDPSVPPRITVIQNY